MLQRGYPKRRLFLLLAGLPWNLLIWSFVAMIRLFWGTRLWWSEWSLWTELRPMSWPTRTWYLRKLAGKKFELPPEAWPTRGRWLTWGGTTLGHGGWYGPGVSGGPDMSTECEFHEHVHVQQFEVFSVLAFVEAAILALLGGAVWGSWEAVLGAGLLWTFGGTLGFGSGWIVAWFRGERAYRDSVHENHAYSVAHDLLTDFLNRK